jgi:hypothetical protein
MLPNLPGRCAAKLDLTHHTTLDKLLEDIDAEPNGDWLLEPFPTGILAFFRFREIVLFSHYRLTTLSASTVRSTKIFVVNIVPFFPSKSDSRTPRVLAQERQT